MAYEVNDIAISTEGYICDDLVDDITLATHGYVCDVGAVAPIVRTGTWRMWTGSIGIDVYGRYDRG
jgi:hypothetical protein